MYLYYLNFNLKKEDLFKFMLIHMNSGRGTIKGHLMYLTVFRFKNKKPLFTKNDIKIIKADSQSRYVSNVCAFYQSDMKREFFDISWKFIDEELFPRYIYMKFIKNFEEYIKKVNNNEKEGIIALFHLGLLGKYERGELEI